ncbi:MAG: J domain-containing protein [Methylococcaceae bacterium]|nr:J domain-containing protein [Methylococcaceae bacterium]MDZ4155372.1 J domain-containing protein [Methylococcales bacterium]MDP2392924.1 J domain-containing protein [Methylococcaceae bacterium]MDP3018258.1 J domain-containing protein [Methylococcaceae bacterium]MDP3391711.1 J domain-containing protein [Methylococcaceae bacterium]
MTSKNQKNVSISDVSEQPALSRAQKQFNNLIKKINAQKELLLEWQQIIPEYNRKVAQDYGVLLATFNEYRVQMVQILDRAYHDKLFKKTDKLKIEHLISEITADLIGEVDNDELKELHNKYSGCDFDTAKQEADAMAGEFMKSMIQDMFNVDIGDEVDLSSPEKIKAMLHELKDKDDEKQRETLERKSKRKKTAKQLEKEARQQQEEQTISQSIREVFRKLSSALHPDREQDETERARKTEIMQRVNAAYAKKDLLRLLELQLEAEQIDQAHLNNIAEDRLKYFNKILKEQLDELQQEITQIEYPFKLQLNIPPYLLLSPKYLMQTLEGSVEDMKHDISQLQQDLQEFQDAPALKAWLKKYKIPKRPNIAGFDGLFFDDF